MFWNVEWKLIVVCWHEIDELVANELYVCWMYTSRFFYGFFSPLLLLFASFVYKCVFWYGYCWHFIESAHESCKHTTTTTTTSSSFSLNGMRLFFYCTFHMSFWRSPWLLIAYKTSWSYNNTNNESQHHHEMKLSRVKYIYIKKIKRS